MSKLSLIYDYETLSLNRVKGAVLALAAIPFDEDRFTENPYSWEELLQISRIIKFDVTDQVKRYKRVIDKSTLEWWNSQGAEAQKLLKPSIDDRPIDDLYDFFNEVKPNPIHRVYTRGNTFDPIFTDYLLEDIGKPDIIKYNLIRDTRSLFEGMAYGTTIKQDFIPEECKDKFIAHDPVHDIAMDIIRFQKLAQAVV